MTSESIPFAGCIFSAYLLYVLKFILQDFCIVCTTFHITNFSMLAVVIAEYRNPTIHPVESKAKDA